MSAKRTKGATLATQGDFLESSGFACQDNVTDWDWLQKGMEQKVDEIDTKSTLVVQGLLKPFVSTLANLAKGMNTKKKFFYAVD